MLPDDLKLLAPFGATAEEEIGETNELLSSSKETDFKQALRKFSETSGGGAPKEHRSNDAKNNEKGKPSSRLQGKTDEEEELFEEDEEDETGFCDETEDYMTSRLERSVIKGEFSVNRNLVDRITSLVDFDNFNHFTNKTSQWAGSDFI